MAPTLILTSNNPRNPQAIDLSRYLDLTEGSDMDPQDPAFSNKIISHSLLKQGGVLALEDLQAKELVFPVKLHATSSTALALLIASINQVVTNPGTTYSWQDTGMSQPTTWQAISGELDVKYSYRQAEKFWCLADLKLFTQPLGHAATSRTYATASGYGPLLMISPYNPTTASTIIGATGAGFGGQPYGASTSVLYAGAPSLAGDAAAQLQISYAGPIAVGATQGGVAPYTAVSLLPGPSYNPLVGASALTPFVSMLKAAPDAVMGAYVRQFPTIHWQADIPLSQTPVPLSWAGEHRLFAIARASAAANAIVVAANAVKPQGAIATVYPGDWQLLDLGTIRYRASQVPPTGLLLTWHDTSGSFSPADITALITLPEATTWFFNPRTLNASTYGYYTDLFGGADFALSSAPFGNTIVIDDVIGEQFMCGSPGGSATFVPTPGTQTVKMGPITPFTRATVPQPDPHDGLPILALLGVGQINVASVAAFGYSGQWANPQNLRTLAQVNVLERTRYILP